MNLIEKLFKDDQVIIQEIHDSFDNAQDELLLQANHIIKEHEPKLDSKADRLQQLGFVNSEIVLDNLNRKQILVSSKRDADGVNYYKNTYPFLKFLKIEQLDSICKKYDLIYAPVGRYKKDVPEKNLLEIENAQPLKTEDKATNKYFARVKGSWYEAPFSLKRILRKGFYIDKPKSTDFRFLNDSYMLKLAKEFGGYNGNYTGYVSSSSGKCSITEEDRQGLFIAAPKSHFDLDGMKSKGLGFFNFTVTEVKDPIVFRYVKGGIQVLSKWGLEANDEMLQHEILN